MNHSMQLVLINFKKMKLKMIIINFLSNLGPRTDIFKVRVK